MMVSESVRNKCDACHLIIVHADDWSKLFVDGVCPGVPTHVIYTNQRTIHEELKDPIHNTTIQLLNRQDVQKEWEKEGPSTLYIYIYV